MRPLGLRPRLKPKRDALTRVRHDLRSLVHSVVGYSDLLAEPHYGSLSHEQTRFVDHLRTAAEQLQELVDTCIELTRPVNDQFTLELPDAPIGQALRRVRNTLVSRGVVCDLTIVSALEARVLSLDVVQLERAIMGVCMVLTRDGSVTVALHAAPVGQELVIALSASDAGESGALRSVEEMTDEIGNRDFVRLKLSEVLLARADADLTVSAGLDAARIKLALR